MSSNPPIFINIEFRSRYTIEISLYIDLALENYQHIKITP
jgi:hypothetical protein